MSAEEWLLAHVYERLSAFDALALRGTSRGLQRVAASVCYVLLGKMIPAEELERIGGLRAWRALVQVHAPPRLVCIGGYNSNWNRHEPVLQEGDALGCEDSVEVVFSLTGGAACEQRRQLPRMQQKRADVAVVSAQKKLYALGGRHGEVRHDSVECLDLVRWRLDDAGWQRMPSMLECRSGLAAATLGEGLIVAGGRSNRGVIREAEYGDRRGFSYVGRLEEPREYAAAAAVRDEFWVLGGGAVGRSSTVEVFDAERGWRWGPEMREKRYGAAACWHDRLYVLGGSHHFRKRKLTTLEALDPREGVWQCYDLQALEGPGYQSSLWGTGLAAMEGSLYICGGAFRDLEESLSSVYRLDLRSMQLSLTASLEVPRWCGGACIV